MVGRLANLQLCYCVFCPPSARQTVIWVTTWVTSVTSLDGFASVGWKPGFGLLGWEPCL